MPDHIDTSCLTKCLTVRHRVAAHAFEAGPLGNKMAQFQINMVSARAVGWAVLGVRTHEHSDLPRCSLSTYNAKYHVRKANNRRRPLCNICSKCVRAANWADHSSINHKKDSRKIVRAPPNGSLNRDQAWLMKRSTCLLPEPYCMSWCVVRSVSPWLLAYNRSTARSSFRFWAGHCWL